MKAEQQAGKTVQCKTRTPLVPGAATVQNMMMELQEKRKENEDLRRKQMEFEMHLQLISQREDLRRRRYKACLLLLNTLLTEGE